MYRFHSLSLLSFIYIILKRYCTIHTNKSRHFANELLSFGIVLMWVFFATVYMCLHFIVIQFLCIFFFVYFILVKVRKLQYKIIIERSCSFFQRCATPTLLYIYVCVCIHLCFLVNVLSADSCFVILLYVDAKRQQQQQHIHTLTAEPPTNVYIFAVLLVFSIYIYLNVCIN